MYKMCNRHKTVIYTGATDDLRNRVYFHKKRLIPGFTKKYVVDRLVYYEFCDSSEIALKREKQIKGYNRVMISEMNPEWSDLWDGLSG